MILYLDASALVRRYIAESGSDMVASPIANAEAVSTSVISREKRWQRLLKPFVLVR
ncbi:MAG: hypothetical protein BMS9Abin02_2061 [Anaerolineae bacterium]|nr:MAG: hypothetical protein BMS9Abin02_2061 [Anaerolineae bacterium]